MPKVQVWELASGRFVEEHASVLLCGSTGVGKTLIAQALGLEVCRQRRRVLFVKTSALLADLAGGSWQGRLRRYLKPELLIIDDFRSARVHSAAGRGPVRAGEPTLPAGLAGSDDQPRAEGPVPALPESGPR
jgi:DNA replication protein DnaC